MGTGDKKSLSSYGVFLNFIRTSPTGEVDVRGVFSKPCFESWLATRPGEIKHPAQSYQRVLYAHIRGADHRKPFTAEVEEQLLKLLRLPNTQSPWKTLFAELQINVGKRGFRRKGFHEGKLDGEQQISEISSEESSGKLRKRKRVPNKNGNTTGKRQPPPAPPTPSTPVDEQSILDLVVRHPTQAPHNSNDSVIPSAMFPLGRSTLSLFPGMNMFFKDSLIQVSQAQPSTAWEALVPLINKYIPYQARLESLTLAAERGLDVYTPALYYFLNEPTPQNDIRYSWDFIIPKPSERQFVPDRPVGTLIMSGMSVIGETNEARFILGQTSIGKHMFELVPSIALLFYSLIRTLPGYHEDGEMWKRELLKKGENESIICLVRMTQVNPGIKEWLIQDQSDIFPDAARYPLIA